MFLFKEFLTRNSIFAFMKTLTYISIGFFFLVVVSCEQFYSKKIEKKKENTSTKEENIFPKIPKSMNFCGETIRLTDEDIRERLDREILTMVYFQSATSGGFKRSTRFFPQIEKILKEENVHDDIKYLAVIESNLMQAVSPVGAQGFWQFMPATAKIYNLEMTAEVDERLHIEKSTHAACMYLKEARNSLNDWVATCASYNRGLGGVLNDMEGQGTTHYFDTEQNSETARYVYRILAAKLVFENAKEYGYDLKNMDCYSTIATKEITISETIPNLAKWAIEHQINLKILRKLNPWLIGNSLTIRNKNYQISLPANPKQLAPYSVSKL